MKKDVRKIMQEAMWGQRHLIALERGDEKMAQEWLDKIDGIKKPVVETNLQDPMWNFIHS